MTAFPDVVATILANIIHRCLKNVNVCSTSVCLLYFFKIRGIVFSSMNSTQHPHSVNIE